MFLQKLTKGKDSWSLAEVIHAIVILTHFHSLRSFVFACGVNQEVDQAGGYTYQMPREVKTSNTNQTNPKDIPTVDIHQGKFCKFSLVFHQDRNRKKVILPHISDLAICIIN